MYDPKGKLYKSGTTLVGVKLRSPFKDEYYYQGVLMNYAHRSTEELKHEKHDDLPVGIKHFAAAFSLRPELWTNETPIREHFSLMGNKDEYVDTLIAYVKSKRDFLHLWQHRIIDGLSDLSLLPDLNVVSDFSPEQLRVHSLVEKFLSQRQEFYDDIPEAEYDSDNQSLDSDPEYAIDERNIQTLPSTSGDDWRKFLLIRGKSGTGKTFAVLHSIRTTLEATPTGMLSSTYNSITPDIGFNADTIHSAFKYPVNPNERPVINWNIANYNLLLIDELSMVPSTVFDHILATLKELHVRPVVLLCGDQQQQQTIATIQGKTRPPTGILQNKALYKNSVIVNFVQQHGCVDAQFQDILYVIRYYKPSRRTLKELHGQRVLCSSEPSEAEVLSVLQDHPDGMILTVTRAKATTINRIAVNNLFPDVDPCGYVKYDGTDKFQPIYKGMRVIVTQNRDKDLHIVNGQTATVHTMQNATLFLKLSNKHIVAVYPVTAATVDDHR